VTVLRPASVLVTNDTSDPQFVIKAGATVPLGQTLLQTGDFLAAPIWFQSSDVVPVPYGDDTEDQAISFVPGDGFSVAATVFGARTGFFGQLGDVVPAVLVLSMSTLGGSSGGPQVFAGRGNPASCSIVGAAVGDVCFDRDGEVWQCVIAGSPGTWEQRS